MKEKSDEGERCVGTEEYRRTEGNGENLGKECGREGGRQKER